MNLSQMLNLKHWPGGRDYWDVALGIFSLRTPEYLDPINGGRAGTDPARGTRR